MSSDIDRNTLSAYVDGELPPGEVAKVEAHLACSAGDRAVVERLRRLDALLGAAHEAPLREPLPAPLRDLAGSTVRRRRIRRHLPMVGAALAASIALAVGVLLGTRMEDAPSWELIAGRVPPESQLHTLLEAERTGETLGLGGDATTTLIATFLDGDGRPCRELEITGRAKSSIIEAIACREDASWNVEVAVARRVPSAAAEDAIVPASGAGDRVLDAALDALDAGRVLGPDEEAELIARNWRR